MIEITLPMTDPEKTGPEDDAPDLTLGEYLRRQRKSQGLTVTGAARAIKVSRLTFSRWEHDIYQPKYSLALALDQLLSSNLIQRFGHQLKGDTQTPSRKTQAPRTKTAIDQIQLALAALNEALGPRKKNVHIHKAIEALDQALLSLSDLPPSSPP
jgi:Predicted transcriptional regulators